MERLLLVIIGILLLVILALAAKVYFLRKSAQEIAEAFRDRVAADTNTLIDVSTQDVAMRRLAAEINTQLRLLRKERRRYQQGDLELKEAVTNISHDLRTPLTAICGYLELLEREEKSPAAARYLVQIQNRTEAMKGLTEELFRYSVMTSVQQLEPVRVDLVRALEESVLSFYGALQEKAITPALSLPEQPVWRQLDAGALSRVFANLMSNALKYADGALKIWLEPDGSIGFSNPAQGLDAVSVGRLFDRFYTVEAGRSSTGLGLSIARMLTERMGGSIRADYTDGWLTVRLQFPAG